jgi:hypothetical protein
MPRLNLYEQQTSAQGPRASGADFGAAPAQALEGMGTELQVIGNRIQERENLSDRQRLREAFEEAAVPMLDDFDKKKDISSKESIPQFRQALEQKRQELIGKHAGNPESRAKLENQLDNLVSQYTKSAITAKINADQQLMIRTMNQQFEKSALDTDAAPDIWSFAKDENLMLVEDMRPGMSQDQYVAAKRLAYAKPLQAAVKSHLAQGNWEAAEMIMKDENFSKYLTAQEAIPLRIDAAVGRGKVQKEERERERSRKQLGYLLGVPSDQVTDDQVMTAGDLSKASFVQKLNILKMMNGGGELPKDVVDRVTGLDKQDKENEVRWLMTAFNSWDSLTPDQRQEAQWRALKEWPDQKTVDAAGNISIGVNPAMPQLVRGILGVEAARPGSSAGASFRSMTNPSGQGSTGQSERSGYNGGSAESAAAEQLRIMEAELAKPDITPEDRAGLEREIARVRGGMATSTPSTTEPPPHRPGSTGSWGEARGPASVTDDDVKTGFVNRAGEPVDLFQNADKASGVAPMIARIWTDLPFNIDSMVNVDPLYTQAAKTAQVLQNDIVQAIKGDASKDADQYRRELLKIVNIDPKVISSTRGYRLKLHTIDTELTSKANQFKKLLVSPPIPVAGVSQEEMASTHQKQRQDILEALAAIGDVKARLNVPSVQVYTRAEAEKLKPGTRYLNMVTMEPRTRK